MGDTKERIMRTSMELFAKKGYEAVSVSDIAGALGVTKGALYRHFDSKRTDVCRGLREHNPGGHRFLQQGHVSLLDGGPLCGALSPDADPGAVP